MKKLFVCMCLCLCLTAISARNAGAGGLENFFKLDVVKDILRNLGIAAADIDAISNAEVVSMETKDFVEIRGIYAAAQRVVTPILVQLQQPLTQVLLNLFGGDGFAEKIRSAIIVTDKQIQFDFDGQVTNGVPVFMCVDRSDKVIVANY